MNLALRTSVYRGQPLEAIAKAIASAEFDAVQLDLDARADDPAGGQMTTALAERIAESFAAEGLAIAALTAEVDLVSGGDEAVDRFLRHLDLAEHFGCDVVVTGAGDGDDWTDALDAFRQVADEAAAMDLVVAVEVRRGTAVADLDHAELLLEAVESEGLGLSLDVARVAEEAEVGIGELLERVGDALYLAQISDLGDHGRPAAPSRQGGRDLTELFRELASQVPDAVVVPWGVEAADAAAVHAYLARFL